MNLANLIAKNATRLEEADLLYRQAISMRADYTQAYINRGDVLIKLNRTKEAQEVYERALFYDSNNPDIYYNVRIATIRRTFVVGRLVKARQTRRVVVKHKLQYCLLFFIKFFFIFSWESFFWNKEKRHKLWPT